MTTQSYIIRSSNADYKILRIINSLFIEVGQQTAEIAMLKYVKT